MTTWGDALEPRPAHDALCAAILAMARSAASRLAVRDAADGFIRLAHSHRAQLQQRGDQFADHVAVALEAWRLAETAPRGQPLARLGAIVSRPEERVLLGLMAAPQLDRALSRAYQAVAHPGDEMHVGALLDLAATVPSSRLLLSSLFHPLAPLRHAGLVGVDTSGPALSSTHIGVASVVLAALRGEPVAPPDGADILHDGGDPAAGRVAEALGLSRPRPGTVTLLTGPRRTTVPALHVLTLVLDRPGWLVPGGYRFREQAVDYWRWLGWARDAALADAVLVGELDGLPLGETVGLARTAAAATGATMVLLSSDPGLPQVDGASLVITPCGGLGEVRTAEGERLSTGLPPTALRRAVEALGS
jgi:hypothetical protein